MYGHLKGDLYTITAKNPIPFLILKLSSKIHTKNAQLPLKSSKISIYGYFILLYL